MSSSVIWFFVGAARWRAKTLDAQGRAGPRTGVGGGEAAGRPEPDRRLDAGQEKTRHPRSLRLEQGSVGED